MRCVSSISFSFHFPSFSSALGRVRQEVRMMSRDSRYFHRRWCLEDATLMIYHPKLELLVDFDDPSSFIHPANAPLTLGARRAATAAAVGGIGGALGLGPEEDLLTDWRDIGVPPMVEN